MDGMVVYYEEEGIVRHIVSNLYYVLFLFLCVHSAEKPTNLTNPKR